MEHQLRPWRMTDLESLVLYANNPGIAMNMTDRFPHPYTEENGRQFIEMAMAGSPPNILAIEINGAAAGGIGIHPQQDVYRLNAELGYWLAEPYWGKGIITNAVREMAGYAFANWNITRIFARPFGHNIASQKVLEKAGFTLEARLKNTILKNGALTDELICAIRKENMLP